MAYRPIGSYYRYGGRRSRAPNNIVLPPGAEGLYLLMRLGVRGIFWLSVFAVCGWFVIYGFSSMMSHGCPLKYGNGAECYGQSDVPSAYEDIPSAGTLPPGSMTELAPEALAAHRAQLAKHGQ